MTYISWTMAIFAIIAAIDRIFGNRLGLGKEFDKAVGLLAPMVLSMVGMIVLSPAIAKLFQPLMEQMTGAIDPSVIPGILFANDMGGAPLAFEVANNESLAVLHGLVVSSMMGATVSFTLPYAIGVVPKEKHRVLFLGFLCGIITVPLGALLGGVLLGVSTGLLLLNLLPLAIFSAFIAFGILRFPTACIKAFSVVGSCIKVLVTVGLAVGIFTFLTGKTLIPYAAPLQEGMDVVINAMCVMTGAFPLLSILSRLLKKPLMLVGGKMGINPTSAMGFLSSLATNVTTFGLMEEMDEKGALLNAAFAVSGAFTFAGHLAFTLAFLPESLPAVIAAKLFAGVTAVIVAALVCRKMKITATPMVEPQPAELSTAWQGEKE